MESAALSVRLGENKTNVKCSVRHQQLFVMTDSGRVTEQKAH